MTDEPIRPVARARARFPKTARLRSRSDFQRVYREGRRARGKSLIVVAAPNDCGHTRLGLSVGRTIWRDAVQRNRVRRVFREAFRLSRAELPAGCDLILIPARPKLVPVLEDIRRELIELARRVAR